MNIANNIDYDSLLRDVITPYPEGSMERPSQKLFNNRYFPDFFNGDFAICRRAFVSVVKSGITIGRRADQG
jgi:hypothetical protein